MSIDSGANSLYSFKEVVNVREGRHLYVEIVQSSIPEKGTLVFIHGVGGSTKIWKDQVEYFVSEGYRTLAMDLVGHGSSPLTARSSCCCKRTWPIYSTSSSISTCLQCPDTEDLESNCLFNQNFLDVLAILDKYVIDYYRKMGTSDSATVVLIAHSYGVPLALNVAQSRQEVVSGLVLIAGGAPVPLTRDSGLLSIPPWFLACFTSCLRKGFEMRVYADPRNPTDPFGFDDIKVLTSEERAKGYQFNAYTLWAVMAGQWWPQGGVGFYRQVQLPVLLMSGTEDKLVTLEEEMETHFTLKKSILSRLPGSGHMCMIEGPDLVNRLIDDHIKKCTRGPHSTATITSQPSKRLLLENYVSSTRAMSEKPAVHPAPPDGTCNSTENFT